MKLNWKKIFDWSIRDVSPVMSVKDAWGHVKGYRVVVSYVHHGDDVFYFDVCQENLYTQYMGPEDAAKQTRNEYWNKMMRQQMTAKAVRQK